MQIQTVSVTQQSNYCIMNDIKFFIYLFWALCCEFQICLLTPALISSHVVWIEKSISTRVVAAVILFFFLYSCCRIAVRLFHIHISFSSTSSATSCNGYTPVCGGGGGERMTDAGFCCCCWNTSIWVSMTDSLVFAYCGISLALSSNSGIFDAWYWWCWCWCWWRPFVLMVTIGTSSWPIAKSIFISFSWLKIKDVGVPADDEKGYNAKSIYSYMHKAVMCQLKLTRDQSLLGGIALVQVCVLLVPSRVQVVVTHRCRCWLVN